MNSKLLCAMACIIANVCIAHAQTNIFPSTGNAGINTLTPATPLQVIGSSRFGSATNYGQFDDNGNLSFTGTANYKVGGNKYAFQFATIPNYGLFFNSTNRYYEFRNSLAAPVFYIGADSGQGVFSGGVSVGSTNLPPTNGMYVSGKLGIGINAPDVKLHVTGGSEVTLTNGGTVVVGQLTNENLAIDKDEIQARSNGVANTLHLNQHGGTVNLSNGNLVVKDATGFVGIGTTTPGTKLHVTGGTNLSLGGGGYIISGATTANNLVFDDNEIQARSNGSAAKLFINDNGGDISLSSGAIYINGTTKQIGFGTSLPSAPLHITNGTDVTLTSGGYVITGATSGANVAMDNNEIQARNNNAASVLFLNNDGGDLNVGNGNLVVSGSFNNVGIQAPPTIYATLQVGNVENSNIGIGTAEQLQDADDYTISTNSNFRTDIDDLAALGTSVQRWRELWAIDGTINTSDARDKSNIRDLNYGLKEIMKLRSVRFNWKSRADNDNNDKIGLIAQELQKVLPEVVKDHEYKRNEATGKDEKIPATHLGVMYADIIPVIIRGMQQQQDMIEDQNKKIETLTQMITQLTGNNQKTNNSMAANNTMAAMLGGSSLAQNAPNPFNQTTVIKYTVPQNAVTAFIQITDINGRTVKTITAAAKGSGQITLQAGELTAGTYQYSLIVNGQLIDTKRMILTK
jgi:hypothetical protein